MDRNLVDYLPTFVKQYKEFLTITEMEQTELEQMEQLINEITQNSFIQTANEKGIKRFETVVGIIPKKEDTLELRRFRILSKWNEELPYTYLSLFQWLTTNLGEHSFKLNLYHETYLLELIIKEYSNPFMRNVIEQVKERIPANLFFIPIANYLQQVKEQIKTELVIQIIGQFYTRERFLYLDGTWHLNGTHMLNGSFDNEREEFYPNQLKAVSYINIKQQIDNKTMVKNNIPIDLKQESSMSFYEECDIQKEIEERVKIYSDMIQENKIESQLIVEKDLWYLDGTVSLDGTRILDAEIKKLVL